MVEVEYFLISTTINDFSNFPLLIVEVFQFFQQNLIKLHQFLKFFIIKNFIN